MCDCPLNSIAHHYPCTSFEEIHQMERVAANRCCYIALWLREDVRILHGSLQCVANSHRNP